MPGRFDGKVAVISGASSGIGMAIADRLAQEGADCVIDYLNHPEVAQAVADKIVAAGGKAVIMQADVSKVADCQRLIDTAWQQLGRCDILVNNAGVEKGSDFCDVTEQDYDFVMDINVKGVFFLTQGLRQTSARC
jgi:glucose 1-dehydrogenase